MNNSIRVFLCILTIALLSTILTGCRQSAVPIRDTTIKNHTFVGTAEIASPYMFYVYLSKTQALHLSWEVEKGPKVRVYIQTPNSLRLGFTARSDSDILGDLKVGSAQSSSIGRVVFSPAKYDCSEGYYNYKILIWSSYGLPSTVKVEYWIEHSVN